MYAHAIFKKTGKKRLELTYFCSSSTEVLLLQIETVKALVGNMNRMTYKCASLDCTSMCPTS